MAGSSMTYDYDIGGLDARYQPDHLGSAAYLTSGGHVTQTLNYLPYGEDWVDIQNNLDPRLGQYTFNAIMLTFMVNMQQKKVLLWIPN